jgi:RimJ/RimL family protein N-acetyltransferase
VIETDRLRLVPLGPDFLDEFVALHEDPEVTRFITAFDRAAARLRIDQSEQDWRQRGYGMLAVLDRTDGRFLGRSGFRYWPEFEEVEIGWALEARFWGRGYATEAGRASLEWGFEHLDVPYFTAMIQPENTPSVAVAVRLGMRRGRPQLLERYEVTVDVWISERSAGGDGERTVPPRRVPARPGP